MKKELLRFVLSISLFYSGMTVLAQPSLNVTRLGATVNSSLSGAIMIGDLSYVGQGSRLLIHDCSNPQMRQKVGEVTVPGTITWLYSTSGHLLIMAGKLYIYSMDSPTQPGLQGSLAVTGECPQEHEGKLYLYSNNGIRTIDLADMAHPVDLGLQTLFTTLVTDIKFQQNLAYVAVQRGGLFVYDISDSTAWRQVANYVTPGFVNCLAVRNNRLFLTDGNMPPNERGLRILDITHPDSIRQTAFLPTTGDAWSIQLEGNYAYISDRPGLRIVDISNPDQPMEKYYLELPRPDQNIDLLQITGNRLLMKTTYSASLWGLADPLSPTHLVDIVTGHAAAAGSVAAWNGKYVLLGNSTGFGIIKMEDLTDPYALSQQQTPSGVLDIFADSSRAWVAAGTSGLYIYDIADPGNVVLLGSIDTPGSCTAVVVKDNIAYIADGASGIRAIDTSNPAAPVEMGAFDTPAKTTAIQIIGSIAYVTDYTLGLRLLNISDPRAITEMGVIDTPGYAFDVAVSGSYAYVADGGKGVRVIDISNVASPVEVGFLDTAGSALSIAVEPPYAYLADSNDGLRILDIRQPGQPVEAGFFDTPGTAASVVLSGNLALVADGASLLILQNDLVTTSADLRNSAPALFKLEQNYPNPFNSSTEIAFTLTQPGQVNLSIFNLLGREVTVLVDEARLPGFYRCRWDADGLPSGIYFYRLATAGMILQKRLLLVR